MYRVPALLQWMAAAEAGRDVCYFTFNDSKLVSDLYDMHKYIIDHRITVGESVQYIKSSKRERIMICLCGIIF